MKLGLADSAATTATKSEAPTAMDEDSLSVAAILVESETATEIGIDWLSTPISCSISLIEAAIDAEVFSDADAKTVTAAAMETGT